MIATLVVGLAVGLHTATWGMYKDSLYEGFSSIKYLRSIGFGILAALLVQEFRPQPIPTPSGLVLLFGLTYVLERLATEWLKVFVRVENQSKYFIPMQFAVLGRPVEHRGIRLAAGLAYGGVLAAAVLGLDWLQVTVGAPSWLIAVAAAGFAGAICAVGGAWKDAPCEGFQLLKFFRSPVIAAIWGALLAQLSQDLVVVGFGALGYSIATIETHKKFRHPDVAPGKFANQPVRFPELRIWRRRFVPVYTGVWAAVLLTMVVAVAGKVAAREPRVHVAQASR